MGSDGKGKERKGKERKRGNGGWKGRELGNETVKRGEREDEGERKEKKNRKGEKC